MLQTLFPPTFVGYTFPNNFFGTSKGTTNNAHITSINSKNTFVSTPKPKFPKSIHHKTIALILSLPFSSHFQALKPSQC